MKKKICLTLLFSLCLFTTSQVQAHHAPSHHSGYKNLPPKVHHYPPINHHRHYAPAISTYFYSYQNPNSYYNIPCCYNCPPKMGYMHPQIGVNVIFR